MYLITLEQIREVLPELDLLPSIEEGFCDYSAGKVVVPPVGEMLLDKGEVHIKYGYVRGEEYYVIKVASGFYGNPDLGLPSSNGLMLLFDQDTGQLLSILLDEGFLTDVRTALAGAVVARQLAPGKVDRIGILGTGTQARLQLKYLQQVLDCKNVTVWGRAAEKLEAYRSEMETEGFNIETTTRTSDVAKSCNLIVCTTPSKSPLLFWKDIRPGTHITAIGSDTPEKQELDPMILKHADIVVGDSLEQCKLRGEIYQAIKAGALDTGKPVELGNIISGTSRGRSTDQELSIADLTGVAVQDIRIAKEVYRSCRDKSIPNT
jgi:ornithine cyclodeaminase